MKATHRLSAIKVAGLKAKGFYPDGAGLYLQVVSGGSKSWIYRFTRNGRTRYMGLGSVDAVSLADAREEADRCRSLVRKRIDPIEARKTEQAEAERTSARGLTFRECAETFIASHEAGWRNEKHRQQWHSSLRTFVYPFFGDEPVHAVNMELVLRVLQPIWSEKAETASRVRGRIEAVLDWAKVKGARDGENPARWRGHLDHLLPARSKVRRVQHHAALPYTEVPAFMADLRTRDGIAAKTLEFTILTASRTGEARGAQWPEIDLKSRVWTVPAERMKGGREHRVPLVARAVEILREMAEIRRAELVFFNSRQGTRPSTNSLWLLLQDLRPGVTNHGFRSSFRDWAAETTNFPSDVVEMALAHAVSNKVEAAYRRGDLFEKRRKLMDAWSIFCERASVSAEVVPLQRKRV